jgi:large subunit ribosomal protein L4
MANITVVDNKGKKVDSFGLDKKIFNGKVNKALLQQVVVMYLANQRKSSAKVKQKDEVRGGGRKPWRQKGTGRARAGSIRSPLWRGGGVTFGPKPKDWHYQVPKKIKRQALISSFNAKFKENSVTIIDELKPESHKTKDMLSMLKALKLDTDKLIIISGKTDLNLLRAARNIKNVALARAEDVSVYQVLVNDKILLERKALQIIEKRIKVI